MLIWHKWNTLWRNLTRKRAVDADLDNELRSYQQLLVDEKLRGGAGPATACRESLLELGGAEQIKEAVRGIRLGTTIETIFAELRQSLRGLRRNPSLTILGTVMLALGTGASIVVFSIFQSALLQPLPFRDSRRIVSLWETRPARGIDQASFSEANFWDVRAQNLSFEEVAAYHNDEANLTGDGLPEKVTAISITSGFLRTLGVSPILGRDFTYDDDRNGYDNRLVIIGNHFWKTRFSADPAILGKSLRLNDKAFTVVGVLPPGEPWIDDQLYTPFGYRSGADRGSWEFQVIGRLKPGVSTEAANADLYRIAANLSQAFPKEDQGMGFLLTPSTNWIANDTTRRALWILLGAVTFLLLIACLNFANLLLARGTARQREIAVRTALGASRARLIRFVMMESLLLNALGTALGLVLAFVTLRFIQSLELSDIPRLADAGLNPWVLSFAVFIALGTGVLSGLAPALQAPKNAIASALRDSDRQTGSRSQGRLRAILVTGEVALSFLLLVGAGLLIRSFTQLMNTERGFQTENRLLFSVNMPGSYFEKGVGKQFLDRFTERLTANPDVLAVGIVSNRPVEGNSPGMSIDSNSRPQSSGDSAPPWAGWRVVSPGYFRAVGLPLLRGRDFDAADKPVWAQKDEPPYQRRVVISNRLAKQLFPNEDPISKHVVLWKGQGGPDAEVIGVVGDSLERGLAKSPTLTVFFPVGPRALANEFVVHTRGNPLALVPTVRSLVAAIDPNLPISDIRSFDQVVYRSVAPQRFNVILLSVFSGLALLLATTGIYGVLSYSIGRRTSEIGLRVALGASRTNILLMTVRQGLRPALLGTALGALGAWWLSRYLGTLLFNVKPFDALTYAAVAAILLATAALACFLPGRRAMRIDPATALRIE
jgi:putative ABC transport system permease protein